MKKFACLAVCVPFLLIFLTGCNDQSGERGREFVGEEDVIAVENGKQACADNMREIMIALHHYHDVHGTFPPLYTVNADGKPLHSWRVLILPYLEQAAVYDGIRLDEPWDSEYNREARNVVVPTFSFVACPNNPSARGMITYAAIAGEGFVPATEVGQITGKGISDITDGTSNTIAIVEVREPFNWMDPTADVTLDELARGINVPGGRVGSFHPGGVNVGMFDAFVRFVPETIDLEILHAAGTIAGSEDILGWWR